MDTRQKAVQYLLQRGHKSNSAALNQQVMSCTARDMAVRGDSFKRQPGSDKAAEGGGDTGEISETPTVQLSVYVSCVCGFQQQLAQDRGRAAETHRDSESDSDEDELDLKTILSMITRLQRTHQPSPAARKNLTRLAASVNQQCLASLTDDEIIQMSSFLSCEHQIVKEMCLKVLQQLLSTSAPCPLILQNKVLIKQVKDLAIDNTLSSTQTQIAALQVLERLLGVAELDYDELFEVLDVTVFPAVVHILHGSPSEDLKLAACGVLGALARDTHFAARIMPDCVFLLQQLQDSRNTKLQGAYVSVLTTLYAHPGLTEAGSVDTGLLPVVRGLLKNGPCESQRYALDILNCVMCDGHGVEAITQDHRIIAYILACLLGSKCRKARAGAVGVLKILTGSRKKAVARRVLEGASYYVSPETTLQATVGGGKVAKVTVPSLPATPGKFQVDARLWHNMDCLLDSLAGLIRKEALLDVDGSGLQSELPVKGEVSPVQVSCLTYLVQVVTDMCCWPLHKPSLGPAPRQVSKEELEHLCNDFTIRERYSMLNHRLTVEQWHRFGPSLFAIFRLLIQRVTLHCPAAQPPGRPRSAFTTPASSRPASAKSSCAPLEDILSEMEYKLLTALLYFSLGVSIMTCKQLVDPLTVAIEWGGGDAATQSDPGNTNNGKEVNSGGARHRHQEMEALSDRLAVRRGLFNEGIFPILAQLLKFPDPEIKKLCGLILRTAIQPMGEKQVSPPGGAVRCRSALAISRSATDQHRLDTPTPKRKEKSLNIALHHMSSASATVIRDALDLGSEPPTPVPLSRRVSSVETLHSRPASRQRELSNSPPIRTKQLVPGQPVSKECQKEAVNCCAADVIQGLFCRHREVKWTYLLFLHDVTKYGTTPVLMSMSTHGLVPKILDFIRVNDDDEQLVVIGLIVAEQLIQRDDRLKQLFSRHGGHTLLMALSKHSNMYIRAQVRSVFNSLKKAGSVEGSTVRSGRSRPFSAPAGRSLTQTPANQPPKDIWDHIMLRWQEEDRVVEVLQKFL